MKPRKTLALVLSIMAMVIFNLSCEKDNKAESKVNLVINLEHRVSNNLLQFDTMQYVNAAGNRYKVNTLKYFISNVQLHTPGGDIVAIEDVHYVDALDPLSMSFSPDTKVERNTYNGISFTFGLDTIMNTTGRFSSAPESNMEWPFTMGGGYHYMKLEGKYDSSGAINSYKVHTGALMGTSYAFDVYLTGFSIEPSADSFTITLIMDINQWFEQPNVYDFNTYGAAIMGNAAAQKLISENGSSVFSVKTIQ